MRPVTPEQKRRSPGPSQFLYRIERLWKRQWVRRLGLSVLPAALVALAGWQIVTSPTVRAEVDALKADLIDRLSTRPEFAVTGLSVTGASVELTKAIQELVPIEPGMSSLSMKVEEVQARLTALGAVKTAHVGLAPSGVLQVSVVERIPVALWRDGTGALWQVDIDGVAVAGAVTRAGYPELPVILGDGAPRAVAEALDLMRAAPGLMPRVRALIRVGGRRWDIALDRGQRILLPETGGPEALARVMAWDLANELLARDVARVDLRMPGRPTVRLSEPGAELYRLRRAARGAPGEET